MKPKISVIIPSFNQGVYISETLQSIIDQKYENTELIIIDGGSTDSTLEVIQSFTSHISYWVSEPDKGQADALRKGLKKATGDICCWINSDDYFLPGAFDTVSRFFASRNDQACILSGNTRFIESEGKLVWEPKKETSNEIVPLTLSAEKLLYCWNFSLSQPSTFWNRKVMDLVGMPEDSYKFAMDLEYWLRMQKAGAKFYFTPAILSCFRYHSESKTTNLKKVQRDELNTLGQLYLDSTAKKTTYKKALDYYFDCSLLLIQSHRLARKNRKESRSLLRTAITNKPICLFTRFGLIFKILVKQLLKSK